MPSNTATNKSTNKKSNRILIPDLPPVEWKGKLYYAPVLTRTSKMPCHSFSITALRSCPNADTTRAGSICAKCYAVKYKRFKLAYAYQAVRFDWVRACMKTDTGRELFISLTVRAIELTGDKYFSKLVDGTLCYDYVHHTYTYSFTTTLTGGTGIFEGATGTFTGTGSGIALQQDYAGNDVFGSNHTVSKGTINLAH